MESTQPSTAAKPAKRMRSEDDMFNYFLSIEKRSLWWMAPNEPRRKSLRLELRAGFREGPVPEAWFPRKGTLASPIAENQIALGSSVNKGNDSLSVTVGLPCEDSHLVNRIPPCMSLILRGCTCRLREAQIRRKLVTKTLVP